MISVLLEHPGGNLGNFFEQCGESFEDLLNYCGTHIFKVCVDIIKTFLSWGF
jgi:hypothetical protein